MCIVHRLIDVHVHNFIEGVVDKMDTSCTAPCITIFVMGAVPNAMSIWRAAYEQPRPLQKLTPCCIQNLPEDRWGSFDRKCNVRGQVVSLRHCADMARKRVTQQLICLLLIRDGQGCNNVSQSCIAISELHWQGISIGLIPPLKQTF